VKRAAHWAIALATVAALIAGACVVRQVVVASSTRLGLDLVEDRLGGAIVDHVVRARGGLPIYAEPDDHFVPVVYTPLYYHVAARVMVLVPDALKASRVTSLGFVVAAAAALAFLTFRTTRSAWATALALCFAAAGYRACEFFYDAPRTDPAAAFFTLAAVAVAAGWRGAKSGLVVGLLLALAFWSKQSYGLFIAAFLGLLLVDGRDGWRRALVAGASCGVIVVVSVLLVNHATDGRFWRIAIALSGEHRFPFERLVETLQQDWLGPLLPSLLGVAALLLGGLFVVLRGRARDDHEGQADDALRVLLFALVAIVLFTSVSRTRTGGTQKVLIPLVLLLSALLPIGAWWLGERIAPRTELPPPPSPLRLCMALCLGRVLPRLALAAILGCAWFPVADALPSAAALTRWNELLATVQECAKRGQVWLAPWGWVTTRMAGQQMRPTLLALDDWLGVRGNVTGNPVPPKLADALKRQEFAAILFPATGKQRNLRPEIDANYRLERELDPISFGPDKGEHEMVLGLFVPKQRRH
jgi:hypothetical protein